MMPKPCTTYSGSLLPEEVIVEVPAGFTLVKTVELDRLKELAARYESMGGIVMSKHSRSIRGLGGRALTDEQVAGAKEMRKAGAKLKVIAAEYDVSIGVIQCALGGYDAYAD
jgi:hypothetical protein